MFRLLIAQTPPSLSPSFNRPHAAAMHRLQSDMRGFAHRVHYRNAVKLRVRPKHGPANSRQSVARRSTSWSGFPTAFADIPRTNRLVCGPPPDPACSESLIYHSDCRHGPNNHSHITHTHRNTSSTQARVVCVCNLECITPLSLSTVEAKPEA